jgi:hypothetical protein
MLLPNFHYQKMDIIMPVSIFRPYRRSLCSAFIWKMVQSEKNENEIAEWVNAGKINGYLASILANLVQQPPTIDVTPAQFLQSLCIFRPRREDEKKQVFLLLPLALMRLKLITRLAGIHFEIERGRRGKLQLRNNLHAVCEIISITSSKRSQDTAKI